MSTEYKEGDLVEATKGETVIRGRLWNDCTGAVMVGSARSPLYWLAETGFTVRLVERARIPLPTEPGTVIALGDWWLVRLRRHEGTTHSAWELLPMRTKFATENADRNGVKTQCVYGNEWVQAEVEQAGGFTIISKPVTA